MLRAVLYFLSLNSLLFSSLAFTEDLVALRLQKEQEARNKGFALLPHHSNYILPITYMRRADDAINPDGGYELQHAEAKLQISVKVQTFRNPLLEDNGYLFFAYTNTIALQAYNRRESRPIRDSVHSPEFFMQFTTPLEWHGISMPLISPGFIHQSNGQGGIRSRSWDRFYLDTTFAYKDWTLSIKPWYRLAEKRKNNPEDNQGDDNPDIEDFYGHFDINVYHSFGNNNLHLMLRNNLNSSNHGATEINYSYPINKHLSAYVQLFHGYGEMLIDYDQRNTRIGFGFILNSWL